MITLMRVAPAFALLLAIVGCNDPKSANSGSNEASNLKSVSSDGANNAPAQTGLDLSKLPADLKKDAYEYYGLGRKEPIKMSVNQNGNKESASQTVSLSAINGDSAEFTITNDGALRALGEVKVKLDKTGIKVISLQGSNADPDTMELPNDLKVGKSWPFKLPGSAAKISGVNKVVGTEKVKTAVRTYDDALVIETTASGTQGKDKIQLKSKQWLVKGRGQVKAEITNVQGSQKQTISMEESE